MCYKGTPFAAFVSYYLINLHLSSDKKQINALFKRHSTKQNLISIKHISTHKIVANIFKKAKNKQIKMNYECCQLCFVENVTKCSSVRSKRSQKINKNKDMLHHKNVRCMLD